MRLGSAKRRLRTEWQAYRALVAIVSRTARVGDTTRLCRLIVSALNRTFPLAHSALLLWEAKHERFILAAVRPQSLLPEDLVIDLADPLMPMIRQERHPWRREDLRPRRARQGTSLDLDPVRDRLHALETSLVVPLVSHGQAIAVLLLGRKRTGQPYTSDDLAFLEGLAGQMALGIEQMRLADALKAETSSLIESEKRVSLGRLVSGMAHAIHNPLTVISGEAQLYLERFGGQHPEVDTLLHSVLEECERAVAVTRRVSRFAKSASPEQTPVDLGEVISSSLALAGYQVHLDGFEQAINLPSDLPPVQGSATQLQHAFFNILVTACQTIGKEGGQLGVEGVPTGETVEVRVSGTKQLADAQSVTPSSERDQVGVMVAERIIQAHHGTFEIRSSEQTTTFTVRLPLAKHQAAASSSGSSSNEPNPALVAQ